jgi:hypothetical protein
MTKLFLPARVGSGTLTILNELVLIIVLFFLGVKLEKRSSAFC